MIRLAAKGTSWSHFMDYASPALFEVMPARALIAQCREFVANGSDSARFSQIREEIGALLRTRGIDVQLTDGTRTGGELPLGDLPDAARFEAGQQILEVYFTQIFGSEQALLDLRGESFGAAARRGLCWRPGAFYVQWQSDFLEGLRNLYVGFYLDDATRFQTALEQLNMVDSSDVLLGLLGKDDPRAAEFDTKAFHSSFHEMFVRYKDRGVALHRNFLALGVYLVCLYDVLESLGGAYDVRTAVERAQP